MDLKQKWLYNLKIHYIWTFFSSFLFLAPIITLYYQYYWLSLHDIVILWAFFSLTSTLLEIPTSTIWDTIGRVKVMKLSVLSSLFWLFLIFIYPNIYIFYIATFFSALWQALWSGTWHAKLQEDLEASWMQNEFWKVIWRLIALENTWKLFTPVVIYFVLKYLENAYHILAWLDVLAYSIWVFFVFKFIEFGKVEKYKNKKEFLQSQKQVLSNAYNFLIWNKILLYFLILMILANDLGYLARILLPSLVENGVASFLSSYIIWFSVLAWILWNLIVQKIWEKLSWNKLFLFLILLNAILHFSAYLNVENSFILSVIFILISFIIGLYWPTWNHIVMQLTSIQEKATVRSLFLMIIWLFEAFMLLILSYFDLKNALLTLSILMLIWFIFWIYSLWKQNTK